MLSLLVTGDVNGINTDFIDKVKDIGIYHLLAVSITYCNHFISHLSTSCKIKHS